MTESGDTSPLGLEHDIDYRTLKSQTLRLLRGAPRTGDELPGTLTEGLKPFAGRLKVPQTTKNTRAKVGMGRSKAVYYLWGDERRAVRRFINEHEDFVQYCLDHERGGKGGVMGNHLKSRWGDGLYQLVEEEWQMMEADDGE